MDQKTEKIIQELQKIRMTPEAKFRIRNKLIAEMNTAPVLSPYADKHSVWSVLIHSKTFVSIAVCLVVVVSGSSIIVGSQNSLPGDNLYYVKTNVSEPIERVLQTESGVSPVAFETSLVDKRLIEAEELDLKGNLSTTTKAQIKKAITTQTKRVENAVSMSLKIETSLEVISTSTDKVKTTSKTKSKFSSQTNVPAYSPATLNDNQESTNTKISTSTKNTLFTTQKSQVNDRNGYKNSDENTKEKYKAVLNPIWQKHKKVLEKIDD